MLSGHEEMVAKEEDTGNSKSQHADVDVLESASLRCRDGALVLALTVEISLERRVDEQDDCENELDEHGFKSSKKKFGVGNC